MRDTVEAERVLETVLLLRVDEAAGAALRAEEVVLVLREVVTVVPRVAVEVEAERVVEVDAAERDEVVEAEVERAVAAVRADEDIAGAAERDPAPILVLLALLTLVLPKVRSGAAIVPREAEPVDALRVERTGCKSRAFVMFRFAFRAAKLRSG